MHQLIITETWKSPTYPHEDENEDSFFRHLSEERAIEVLEKEFQIFDRQYTKLADDWRRTVNEAQEKLFANTIDKEQTTNVKERLLNLEEKIKRLEILNISNSHLI